MKLFGSWPNARKNRRKKSRPIKTYSQMGEDLLIRFALSKVGVTKPNYLDIGAYDAVQLSNTMFFYQRGCSGVCIEPNPVLAKRFSKVRRRDTVLNVGVGDGKIGEAEFYVMSKPEFSSFNREICEGIAATNHAKIVRRLQVPLLSVDELARDYFPAGIDFLSLDVEGWDERVLESIDFENIRPKVICVETIDFLTKGKRPEAALLLAQHDYIVFADTHINTIFVDSRLLPKH